MGSDPTADGGASLVKYAGLIRSEFRGRPCSHDCRTLRVLLDWLFLPLFLLVEVTVGVNVLSYDGKALLIF